MAVKFNVIERGEPGVVGGGVKKFYASPNMSGEMTLIGLTKAIEKISTVSGADIRAVLYSLIDVMKDQLSEGQIIRLGELGSLRVSFSSDGKVTAQEVNATCIKNPKVVFTPGKQLKEMLVLMEYQKA
ncbi:MAG: DNA-binding protein [Ignavibacteriales bacterium CG18_big_fil_WC_8_21_14_2_50_31_20]|nr:MAG: DNA-binding protein [Ignavibacteriales bacterium CG18_big_fil_WC_8_21_14_2_50_31_20]